MRKDQNVFVRIDEYKDVLDIITLVNEKVKEARIVLGKINDLKNQEDNELDAWRNSLDDVERKMKYIDQTLFEPRY
ncbi:hypothetical protein JXC34_06110 [Candidatus Woesearchaeota archaeon]|nr:hypothetical protein [Candidatus Woesearchaeota archaeon]